jgi:hypothetical protein
MRTLSMLLISASNFIPCPYCCTALHPLQLLLTDIITSVQTRCRPAGQLQLLALSRPVLGSAAAGLTLMTLLMRLSSISTAVQE